MKSLSKAVAFAFAAILLITPLAQAGFKASGTKLLDGNGNAFVMRGINHPYTWYRDTLWSFSDIAATGANTVRVVLSNGQQWDWVTADEVGSIISACKENKLICILEIHDATGYGEDGSAADMSTAVDWWLDSGIYNAMQGQEDYVILNIANEPYGNNTTINTYVSGTTNAIYRLRQAGYNHTIMVDAGNWGQDWEGGMRDNASTIFNSDPQQNVIFDVHMYQVYQDYSTVNSYMSTFANNNLHLVVGEFAHEHYGSDVDEASIMQLAQQYGFGYLGWSWSGNGSCCDTLDIVSNWDANSLSDWGNTLIYGSNGIQATSTIASVYGDSSSNSSSASSDSNATTTSQCQWSDGTLWALCSSDNGSWGWENSASCISSSICPTVISSDEEDSSDESSSSSEAASSSSSTSTTTSTQCQWSDGSYWALCTSDNGGWGWENNQSCISASVCPSTVGTGTTSTTATQCEWGDGTVWALCQSDNGSWGWENNESCVSQSICPNAI